MRWRVLVAGLGRWKWRGERDADGEAAAAARVDDEGGVVGLGDGGGDGKAKPEALVAGRPGGGQPLERLQKPGDLAGGYDWPGVSDCQPGPAPAGDLDVNPAAEVVVADRVVDEVGGQPVQQASVTEHGRGADGGVDGQPAGGGLRVSGI
jgi:hypothetical protein